MESEDAVERVQKAVQAEKHADGEHLRARDELVAAVRAAHAGKVSQAKLARETQLHRNTIAAWCRNAEGPSS